MQRVAGAELMALNGSQLATAPVNVRSGASSRDHVLCALCWIMTELCVQRTDVGNSFGEELKYTNQPTRTVL